MKQSVESSHADDVLQQVLHEGGIGGLQLLLAVAGGEQLLAVFVVDDLQDDEAVALLAVILLFAQGLGVKLVAHGGILLRFIRCLDSNRFFPEKQGPRRGKMREIRKEFPENEANSMENGRKGVFSGGKIRLFRVDRPCYNDCHDGAA